MDDEFLSPRRCMREPISEIFHAAHLLDRAVSAHLTGNPDEASQLIRSADMPAVRSWTESLWGSKDADVDQWKYHRFRVIADAPPNLLKAHRVPVRMPNAADRCEIIAHFGHNCAFCGIPLISKAVRAYVQSVYPQALLWGDTNSIQHAAFQCMWMQFDHVLPHSRGGDNSFSNVVLTCAPCNYGRGQRTLKECGLIDPRSLPVYRTSWDGLERALIEQSKSQVDGMIC